MIERVDLADNIFRQIVLALVTGECNERRGRKYAAEIPNHRFIHMRPPLLLRREAARALMGQERAALSERFIHTPLESEGKAHRRERLQGRRVLIVGGGQQDIGEPDTPIGNGRAISVLFAREGAAVAVADRDRASAGATVAMIE